MSEWSITEGKGEPKDSEKAVVSFTRVMSDSENREKQ